MGKDKICTKCKKREVKYTYCEECARLESKKWYAKNREYKISMTIKNLQINNYSYEKTPKQMEIRKIKANTRAYFPLKDKNCEFCGEKATERHHNTFPIQYDKFNFVCHKCHRNLESQKQDLEIVSI